MNNKKGLVINITGLDGVGKETQTVLLTDKLNQRKYPSIRLSFPDYNEKSGQVVQEYLAGDFVMNSNLDSVKRMSSLYSVNRVTTLFRTSKETYISPIQKLNLGYNLVLDRYTSCNILHQTCDMNKDQIDNYIKWITELEYNDFNLPKPDITIFLDLPLNIALKHIAERHSEQSDCHETSEHLKKVYDNKDYIIDKCDWNVIKCYDTNGDILPIDVIHKLIYTKVLKLLI